LDGTLYFNPSLINHLRKKYIQYYVRQSKNNKNNFIELERKGVDWIDIIRETGNLNTKKLMFTIEKGIVKDKYVRQNLKLANYFKISSKENFLFTNSDIQQTFNSLHKLGVKNPSEVFVKIITTNDLDELKPSKKSFNLLLKSLGRILPDHVIYVGDSEKQDIVPAGKLGFKTIFINNWGKNNVGDFNYNNINLLIHDLKRFENLLRSRFIKYLAASLL